jgi:hypothetical protein
VLDNLALLVVVVEYTRTEAVVGAEDILAVLEDSRFVIVVVVWVLLSYII